ncbi:hypothetical protein PsYK624_128490 [Phanerochaete sordida]|uniref:Transmembrane protein n=1 Tax=Phanerochaete sordida TaxID=48140 RepID=A0A9P3GNK2_9APHY|nr:hypothetical protein PsYK624_128490 [Phanerochaete sordida]
MPSAFAQAGTGAGVPAGFVLGGGPAVSSFASVVVPTPLVVGARQYNESSSSSSVVSTGSQTQANTSTLSSASSTTNATDTRPPPTSSPTAPASQSPPRKAGTNHQTVIIAAVVASVAVLLVISLIFIRQQRKRRRLQRLADLTYKPAPRVASFVAHDAGDTRLSSQMSLLASGLQGSSVISTNAYTHDEVPLSGRFRSLSISSSRSAGTYRPVHRPLPPPAADEVVHITMPAAQPAVPRGSPLVTGGWGGAEEQDDWDPTSPLHHRRSPSPDAPRASPDTGRSRSTTRKRPPRLSISTPANNPSAWGMDTSDHGQV